jgi:hypothetical protein
MLGRNKKEGIMFGIVLEKKQKEMLESILETGDGTWLYNMGYGAEVMYRIVDIIEKESYGPFDRELLNEIRSYWLSNVGMRI